MSCAIRWFPKSSPVMNAEIVLAVLSEVPRGKVVSYKMLAELSGYPKNARQVGRIMRFAPPGYPCHRVVHQDGRMGYEDQEELLKKEGVPVHNGRVDMKIYAWRG